MKESDAHKEPLLNKIQGNTFLQYNAGNIDDVIHFILNTMPVGIILLNRKTEIVYCNKQADLFLSRFQLPEEIISVSKRIFDAINQSRLHELFPGEIHISKKFDDSPNNWIFRFSILDSSPVIALFIIEDKVSNKLNVSEIRQQYRLTRRETDILRRVLDGLKNIEISKELDIMEQTVKDHLSNIYLKIGVGNRFDLVRSLVSPTYSQG
jgi:DNA-binding CsgD family transcriptional regulator